MKQDRIFMMAYHTFSILLLFASWGLTGIVIYRDRSGAYWSEARGGGVCLLWGATWTHYGTDAGFPPERVSDIRASRDGALWFLTVGGGQIDSPAGAFTQTRHMVLLK